MATDPALDLDELEARGLYDPRVADAADRLALLEYLAGLGATIEDMVAVDATELARVASSIALRARGHLTRAEVAAAAGVAPELAARVWRASGFPDPGPDVRDGTEEDIDALRSFQAGVELLGEHEILQLARVMGSSLARIADAMVSTFLVNVAHPSLLEDPSGLALARSNGEAVALLRSASAAMDYLLRRHIEIAQRPLASGSGETQALTVGFVDLVGSTALAQRLPIAELGVALSEFDELASDLVISHGARIVKLIGDEVMFVAGEARAACSAALAITAALDDHPRLPPGRAALACGDVLTRDGDYFGPVVNRAARAVKLAEPGRVVVADEVRVAVDDDAFVFVSLGAHVVKGFETPIELFDVTPG